MTEPGQNLPAPTAPQQDSPGLIAPLWHTVLLLLIVAAVAYLSAGAARAESGAARIMQYLSTIAWLWLLLLYVWWGLRLRGRSLRQIIGGRWKGIDDVLLDIAIAAGFWITALLLLGAVRYALGHFGPGAVDQAVRTIGFLAPRSPLEIALWIGLSLTAGFCEEAVFRGYLQRQFSLLARNAAVGVVLAAVVFGFGHGYQGAQMVLVTAVFGAMFGILAYFRGSLRPGMIAHAWQNILAGLLLSMLTGTEAPLPK